MYEHAIPQNITEFEFKLFAGLTVRQFIYVLVSGGLSFALFQLNKVGLFPSLFTYILVPLILIVGLGLGLGSYQKRSLEEWFTSFLRASNVPLRRVWKKDHSIVKSDNFFNTKPTVAPQYLSYYFLTEEEYLKMMQQYAIPSAAQQTTAAPIIPTVDLNQQTVANYADMSVTLPSIPNTIAFYLAQDEIPLEGITAYVSDVYGNVVTALRSNNSGVVYFDKSFSNGTYFFDFQSDMVSFPRVQVLFDGNTYPLIKINPIE